MGGCTGEVKLAWCTNVINETFDKCEVIDLYVCIFNAVQQPKQDEEPFACFISYWQKTQNKFNLIRKYVSDTVFMIYLFNGIKN